MSHQSRQMDIPPQHQDMQQGKEHEMTPKPEFEAEAYKAAGKLKGKVAIITGGDSGIGRAVSLLYAREGADVVIVYLSEHKDAQKTKALVEAEGRECIAISGDLSVENFGTSVIEQTIKEMGTLDILVNNAAQQYPQKRLEDITKAQWDLTFAVNMHAYFYLTKAALPHLDEGSSIINTTSVTAYRGSEHLVDYSATKGAIVSFTRSLALQLAQRKSGIRVNGVAPGPIWTPLIPSSFDAQHVSTFGKDSPMGRVGQPEEVAPAYVFLASQDASYITGQIIHVNGGEVVNA